MLSWVCLVFPLFACIANYFNLVTFFIFSTVFVENILQNEPLLIVLLALTVINAPITILCITSGFYDKICQRNKQPELKTYNVVQLRYLAKFNTTFKYILLILTERCRVRLNISTAHVFRKLSKNKHERHNQAPRTWLKWTKTTYNRFILLWPSRMVKRFFSKQTILLT